MKPRYRWAVALAAILTAVLIVWLGVEHVREARDRVH